MDYADLLFMQLCSWRLHPGYLREGAKAPSLEEIAELANEAAKVWEDYKSWASGQQ